MSIIAIATTIIGAAELAVKAKEVNVLSLSFFFFSLTLATFTTPSTGRREIDTIDAY